MASAVLLISLWHNLLVHPLVIRWFELNICNFAHFCYLPSTYWVVRHSKTCLGLIFLHQIVFNLKFCAAFDNLSLLFLRRLFLKYFDMYVASVLLVKLYRISYLVLLNVVMYTAAVLCHVCDVWFSFCRIEPADSTWHWHKSPDQQHF